jgi:hypothetical protein
MGCQPQNRSTSKTVKPLRLEIHPQLIATADEVIESTTRLDTNRTSLILAAKSAFRGLSSPIKHSLTTNL